MGKTRELLEKLDFQSIVGEDARVELHWMEQEWQERNLQLQKKYDSDKEKYCGWTMSQGDVVPLMNPEYLTKNDIW